jgi:HlyD family secretion protein
MIIKGNIKSPYNGEVVEVLTDASIVVSVGSLFKLKNMANKTISTKEFFSTPSF